MGCILAKQSLAVSVPDVKSEIQDIAGPYSLKIPNWELANYLTPLKSGVQNYQGVDLGALDSQIESVLKDEGVKIIPLVRVRLDKPPLLLVVSPRDKIEYFDRILLLPDLSLNQVESLEDQLDRLNLSSLVVELGGIAVAYPALVSPNMSVRDVIDAAAEEWSRPGPGFQATRLFVFAGLVGHKPK